MNTTQSIKQRISHIQPGEPFANSRFMGHFSRESIDTTLCRFAQEGVIVRIVPGIYMRPKKNRYVGLVSPDVQKVLTVLSKERGEVIQVQDVEAARYYGFTTQVPTQIVYCTSGLTRTIVIGNQIVKLKHVAMSKLQQANTNIGLAIAAFRYLGKENMTIEAVKKVQATLEPGEFKRLLETKMPVWMHKIIRAYRESQNA